MATAAVTYEFIDGATIEAVQHNTNFTELITFLNSNVVHVDGSKAMTGALAMGANKITGLGAPTAGTDAATMDFADMGVFVFAQSGELEVGAGAHRLYLPFGIVLQTVQVSVGVAPTGANLVVDVNVDDVTIFTTQSNRPEVVAAEFYDEAATIEDATHAAGQYVTVDIDQIGSTLPGENLTVLLRYRRS